MRRSNGPLAARLAARLSGLVSGLVSGVCVALALAGAPDAAAETRSVPAVRAPETASKLRVVDARIESDAGTYESGQLYVRVVDAAGQPVLDLPLAVVTSGGVHVGPFAALGGGAFVARIDWAEGTQEASVRLAVGDTTADVPSLALPRRPAAKPVPREARSRFFALGALGVGVGTLDDQLSLLGFRGALDWSIGTALGRGLSAALGVHLGYERHAAQYVRGLGDARTTADVSVLEAGFPFTVRFGASEPSILPYLVLTPTIFVQNSRFILPGNQVIDTDAHFFGVPLTFGVEVPVGPGGVFVQGIYRTALQLGGGTGVQLRGALGEAGYHILF